MRHRASARLRDQDDQAVEEEAAVSRTQNNSGYRLAILAQRGKLREYRQALTTAAVTGQLDVSIAGVESEAVKQREAQTA